MTMPTPPGTVSNRMRCSIAVWTVWVAGAETENDRGFSVLASDHWEKTRRESGPTDWGEVNKTVWVEPDAHQRV
jgi:hypothetical protein